MMVSLRVGIFPILNLTLSYAILYTTTKDSNSATYLTRVTRINLVLPSTCIAFARDYTKKLALLLLLPLVTCYLARYSHPM